MSDEADKYPHVEYQILVHEDTAQVISNTVAVALTLALPRLLVFMKLLLPPCTKAFSWCHQFVHQRLVHLTSFARRHSRGEGGNIALGGFASDVGNESYEDEVHDHAERSIFSEGDATFEGDLIDLPPQPAYIPHTLRQPAHMLQSSSRITSGLTSTLAASSSFEDAAARICNRHLTQAPIQVGAKDTGLWGRCIIIFHNFKEDTWGFILISTLMLTLFGLFIGEQMLAITAAGIVSGSTALSASPNCGLWTMNTSGLPSYDEFFHQLNWFSDAESRAITYAERCYQENSTIDACNTFYQSKVDYEDKHGSPCPFRGNVCLSGGNSAYALDTGYLNSSVLGINGAPPLQFRRRTTCAPLVTNASYVRFSADDPSRVDYLYGNSATDHRTYSDFVGDSWKADFDSSSYKVIKRRGSRLGDIPIDGDMIPLPEFLAQDSEITIFFIRPMSIVYLGPNDDPIFPADVNATYPGGPTIWGNPFPHSLVLGCADLAEIRDVETGFIWIPKALDFNRLSSLAMEKKSLLNLLVISLWRSNVFSAVTSRPGSRLDAQSKLVGSLSQNLDHAQWKIEVRKMFETSLARIQGDVLDVVRGAGKERPYARNALYGEFMSICHMVKFQSVGWRNISFFWLVTLPISSLLLWFLTIEMKSPTGDRQQMLPPGEPDADAPNKIIILMWLVKNIHVTPGRKGLACIAIHLYHLALDGWNLLSLALGWIKSEMMAPAWKKVKAIKWRGLIRSVPGVIKSIFEIVLDIFTSISQTIASFFQGLVSGFEFYKRSST